MESSATPVGGTTQNVIRESPSPRVLRLQHGIVNTYLLGDPGSAVWGLVDAGLAPTSAAKIMRVAEARFGRGVKPVVIVLTHGHFDHVGGIRQLLKSWDVPVFAHQLELPYLTGRSSYPPPDPTVGGGLMARAAGLFPRKPIDLGDRVQALPGDGLVPGLVGWRWVHTPGHTPGHISLFRFSDRVLIAGDAFVTVRQESLLSVLTQAPQVSRPPAYFTPNWVAARQSIETLARLEPEVAATGHGLPMSGERLRQQLRALLQDFETRAVPRHGRYVHAPALADERGVISVPPPVPDPFPKMVCAGFVGLAVLGLLAQLARRTTRPPATFRHRP